MYSETTRSITVTVKPFFLEDQSAPDESHYVWAYHVRIENRGRETVQLRNRHWKITDSHGQMQEVRGPGVVGEQPVLGPGESFEYTSGTHLETSVGTMRGTYQMVADDGKHFDAPIPPFTLSVPRVLH
jgi:ApaG protein